MNTRTPRTSGPYRTLPAITMVAALALALSVRCADYGGEQGFLGFANLPAALLLEVATPETASPSPVESITQVTSTTVTGTTTLLTIPDVDLTRSFVICNQTSNFSNPVNVVTCQLTATNTVTLSTNATSGQIMSVSVVEFGSGAAVQRGSVTLTAGNATLDETLTTVDLTRSFVFAQTKMNSNNFSLDQRRMITPELVNATTLRFTRAATGTDIDIEWQVVELDAASVQSGAARLPAGPAAATVTPTANQ